MFENYFNSSKNSEAPHLSETELETTYSAEINNYEEAFVQQNTEVENLKKYLKEKEKEILKLSQLLAYKEKILMFQNKKLSSNEEELTGYINKIFEQQERERIVKWIVNYIRETLDIENVLKTTVEEIGKLLKVDRCLIALFDKKTGKFELKNEYKSGNEIESILSVTKHLEILPEWEKILITKNDAIFISDISATSNSVKDTQPKDVRSFAIAPVLHKGDILGVILVQQIYNTRDWKEHHVEVLKYIGSQIAISIMQAGLYSDIKKQKDREILLRNILSTIRTSLDINHVKRKIVTETGKAFNADRCYIRMYNTEKNCFMVEDSENDIYIKTKDKSNLLFKKNKKCFFSENHKKGLSICFDNLDDFLKEQKITDTKAAEWLKDLCVKTNYTIPIIFSKNTLGIINLQFIDSNPTIDEEIVELLKTIAAQVGVGIKQIQLYENINKTAKREATIRKIITQIRSTLDINEVLSSVCEEIIKIFNVDRVIIAKYNKGKEDSLWSMSKEYKCSDEVNGCNYCLDNEIGRFWEDIFFKQGKKIVIEDISKNDLPKLLKNHYANLNVVSLLAASIEKGEDKWGGIFISSHSMIKNWTEDEIQLLETITDQLYIAIRQAYLYTESEKTNKLKSEFLAGMSHEFRTPLNAIIGFSEILSTGTYGNLTAKQFEYLNNISVSGTHLLRLVNDILDLSKIESGNMEVLEDIFDTKQVIQETVSILQCMAIKKDINIEIELDDAVVKSDSKRFRQIMYNLLSNAIKFTENNGNIIVRSKFLKNNLQVEIIDTGIGISEEDRNRIFNQFAQIDSSYTRKQEGTGLGLTLTKKLIELLGGTIDVESREGEGSRFWFILPGVIK